MVSATQTAPPAEFVCSITSDIMQDPVMDKDGNTFERTAIEQWLLHHGTSPITRNAMTVADLVPNRALRNTIEEWLAANGRPALAPAAAASSSASRPVPQPLVAVPVAQPQAPAFGVELVVDTSSSSTSVALAITPPERPTGAVRAPLDLVCVIDTSGSMDSEAVAKDADGNSEKTGLSTLDIVKHAVLTVAELLGPKDRLAIVEFSNSASTVLDLALMDTAGKAQLKTTITKLQATGGTNLWAGLQQGMDLAKRDAADRTTSVFLLTDGMPTTDPPRGYSATLQQYKAALGGSMPFSVCTYGFGYSLNSVLLSEIAGECGGSFGYIPDSGMVGTVFVNATANLLATMATTTVVSLRLPAGVTAPSALPRGFTAEKDAEIANSTILKGAIGNVNYGQSRTVVFANLRSTPAADVSPANFRCSVTTKVGSHPSTFELAGRSASEPAQRASIALHATRQAACATLTTLSAASESADSIRAIVALFNGPELSGEMHPEERKLRDALVADLTSEVLMGVASLDVFRKWGGHYVRALSFANGLQQCSNFKDKSLQCYGGEYFRELQALGEKAFLSLPPPVPTPKVQYAAPTMAYASSAAYATTGSGATASAAPRAAAPRAAPKNMNAYYNRGGGCVAPTCRVTVLSGDGATVTTKAASDVRKGDVLPCGSVVACVAKVRLPEGGINFVELRGGLLVSPYHPIRVDGSWHFPIDAPNVVNKTKRVNVSHMYSYVLEAAPSVKTTESTALCATIDGVEVVAFAHNCGPDVPVVGHAFFGTGKSLEALKSSPRYDDGTVEVTSFLRDAETNAIIGLECE